LAGGYRSWSSCDVRPASHFPQLIGLADLMTSSTILSHQLYAHNWGSLDSSIPASDPSRPYNLRVHVDQPLRQMLWVGVVSTAQNWGIPSLVRCTLQWLDIHILCPFGLSFLAGFFPLSPNW
jgi:hypothetical protein